MPTPAAPHSAPRPVGVLRRAGQVFFRWWPVRPTPSATPQVRLQALAAILDEAVHAQPSADRAVAACGEPGPVSVRATQEVAARIAVYHHLIVRLRALDLGSGLLPLGERASRLLAHHEWILHQGLSLACPREPDTRLEAARLRLNGLGAAADDLRGFRDEVRALADRPCGEAERPCGEGAAP